MKFLHVSDLHIGKKLKNRSRLEEQKDVLKEICALCDSNGVDVLLIAGDVYDTFIPSSEAETLFFEFINAVSSPSRAVVAISGNHDDSMRLSAPSVLASKHNAYIFGGENIPVMGGKEVRAEKVGKDFVQIKKGEERVYIGALPYPGELKLGAKKTEEIYAEKIKRWVDECFENNSEHLPQILVSHLFMLGGERSGDERDIELGGARIVEPSCINKDILYTALGHLHKRQTVSKEKNIIYSGSILEYSFDEVGQEKSVTLFEINGKTVENLTVIPLVGGKRLVKLVANGLEQGKELLALYPDSHVFLTLKLDGVLSEVESRELMGNYPQLADYVLEVQSEYLSVEGEQRKKMNDKELFEEYYKSKTGGEEAPEEIMQIYLTAINEVK